MSERNNIARIRTVFSALEELRSKVVFVGGATVSFYRDRPVTELRVTEDVDIVVEIATYTGFAEIEEKLRKKGFVNDISSRVICRYIVQGVIVDIMPTNENVLGFSNPWYKDGFINAVSFSIDTSTEIKILDPLYFLSSKMVAFNNRGKNDGRTSTDFEDIVYLLNNRNAIWDELLLAPPKVKRFLKDQFRGLLTSAHFKEWISAHLELFEQRRINYIIERLSQFSNLP